MRLTSEIELITWLWLVLVLVSTGATTAGAQERPLFLDESKPVEARVEDLLSRLTLEEKVALVHADSSFSVAGVPRLGLDALVMDDGPLGVRAEGRDHQPPVDDFSTAMPATLGLAATWNPELATAYGAEIGQEAVHRGKNIMLAPALNIQRTPLCGRNFEYMGEDPFLTSRLAVNYIRGEQAQGVSSCAKHYAANNQEYQRMSINVEMDERTLREIYLPAFHAAVREAGVLTVMGAYNRFRGQFCCEKNYLLDQVLKNEWGFKGAVMSDWAGVHHTDLAATNGLDMEMGSHQAFDEYYLANPYLAGLKDGRYPVSALDEKVRRNLYVRFKLNLIHDPAAPVTKVEPQGPLSTPAHQETARKVAEETFVLLKNKGLLPLDPAKVKTIAIIGANATAHFANGGGSSRIKPPYEITALQGISNRLGNGVKLIYAQGYNAPAGPGRLDYRPDTEEIVPPRDVSELVAEAVAAAKAADVVIYVGGLNHHGGYDTEGTDRKDIKLPGGQDELIQKIVQANPKTLVVLMGGGAVEMEAWLSKVPAVLYAWYPGLEGGNALARVLFGDVNPSGKLPCTFPKRLADSPAHALHAYPGTNGTVVYQEGLLVGYRWFDTKNIEPLFPFGYGLSYTTFKYSNLHLAPGPDASRLPVTVEFELANTGKRAGAEAAQVYVQELHPALPRPVKELKGFQKMSLAPGEKQKVSIALDRSAFAHYDPDKKGWVADKGAYKILVASSSRDIQLIGQFELAETTIVLDGPNENILSAVAALK